MSDLANTTSVTLEMNTQLPVSWYFDQHIYELEQKHLFSQSAQYIGHTLMVPEVGDYYTLPAFSHGKMLKHTQNGVQLLSNVCRHRQALMLDGKGNTDQIVCPLHRWTYDNEGTLLGAPHFKKQPCLHLGKTPLENWNGLLFTGPRNVANDLASLGVVGDLNFDNYHLDKVMVEEYAFNWKTFIEVYLEDYHVEPFHPGLGKFVSCDDLKWEFGEWYSVQTVGVHHHLARPGSEVYKKWHEQVLQYNQGKTPKKGAIWLVYYPNVMIEWYPDVLVVSTLIPQGPQKTLNVVEFYYPEEIALFEPDFMAANQAAYIETAVEDEEICRRMDQGRLSLYQQGLNEVGPYQSPMEDGMQHFHTFLRREIPVTP